ncbi:hypothetical protein Cantr_00871 [Candida viswanathii]|uniref:Uncharacterized protein n=1 Tax=Candida viswanathii TaxID=5486 RepID=A0A367YGV6_9ASCO|nr:hypothetical protein Cantr_00871 [Candida viswanathii]
MFSRKNRSSINQEANSTVERKIRKFEVSKDLLLQEYHFEGQNSANVRYEFLKIILVTTEDVTWRHK